MILGPIIGVLRRDPKAQQKIKLACATTVLFKLVDIMPEIMLGLMIDLGIHKESSLLFKIHIPATPSAIYCVGATIFLTAIFGNFLQHCGMVQWRRLACGIQMRLRLDLCRQILAGNAADRAPGDESLHATYRSAHHEIDTIGTFFARSVDEILKLILSTLIIGPVLWTLSPRFAVYAILPLVPTFLATAFLVRYIRPHAAAVKRESRIMYRAMDDLFSCADVIKDFSREPHFVAKLSTVAENLHKTASGLAFWEATLVPVARIFIHLGVVGILAYAAVMGFNGTLGFGAMTAVSLLSRKFLTPFTLLGNLIHNSLQSAQSCASILHQIELPAASPPTDLRRATINDLKPGLLNVVTGPTGVGKTTLLQQLFRDHPRSSRGERDGPTIAIVPQRPKLFNASVRDNITLFDERVDSSALQRAIEISMAREFVESLPHGLDTIIGPLGFRLSGGQIHSITLARAFYTNADVYLLDEPTAAFDNERELQFIIGLRSILPGRLIVMTSHRQQPVERADYVLQL